ncbi:ribbon-helix-helix protein, CopG family [Bradyrhizobium manausense]|uniref:ribbon-helix-helix protein, CopG family n=1 Tax=Bradyrhizobium manausense TaxID=989370 RepID=UPI0009FA2316
MTRKTIVVSISLSPEECDDVDRIRKREMRTRTGLIRVALRDYIRRQTPGPS